MTTNVVQRSGEDVDLQDVSILEGINQVSRQQYIYTSFV